MAQGLRHPAREVTIVPYVGLAAPHWRHHDIVAAAGAAIDFLTGAELQVLAHADPHFAEPPPAARHGDGGAAQAGIDLDERVFDLGWSERFLLRHLQKFRWDLYRRARLADGFEISPRAQPRAGAVLVPFVEDQPRRRHQ